MDIFAPRHLIIILLIALVVFGTKKLRTIGSDLGGAVKGFKDAMKSQEAGSAAAMATSQAGTLIKSGSESHALHETADTTENVLS